MYAVDGNCDVGDEVARAELDRLADQPTRTPILNPPITHLKAAPREIVGDKKVGWRNKACELRPL
jgi:hypothetical protein